MQALDVLYGHTGRRAEWRSLVEQIVPDFVDPATDGPLLEQEDCWVVVTEDRVALAGEARQWGKAERLQRILVDWVRRQAADALAHKPEALDTDQRNSIRSLAVSLERLGTIQREVQQPECVGSYEEALTLSERIADRQEAAICAFNLGYAYKDIPPIRNLDRAEDWYRRSVQLCDDRDRLGRGKCLGSLGMLALERFNEARAAGEPTEQVLQHINAALQSYRQALELFPRNAVADLAATHNQLGEIWRYAGDVHNALPYYREAIRHFEAANDAYHAGQTRYNVALALTQSGRLTDAREYARAALRNFESYGDAAAQDVQNSQQLLAQIEQEIGKGGSS